MVTVATALITGTAPMSGAGGRPTKAQAAAKAGALLDAARLVFSQRGFAAATMEEIAASLGWSKHTVYSRFSNKVDLLEAIVERDVGRFVDALEAAKSDCDTGIAPLKAMARAYFGFSTSPGYSALYAAVALEASSSQRLRDRLVDWAATSLSPLREAVAAAAFDGRWQAKDAEEVCAVLIDLLDGEATRVKWAGADGDESELERRFSRRWDIFIQAAAAI